MSREKCSVGLTYLELLTSMLFVSMVRTIVSEHCICDKMLSLVTDKRIYLGQVSKRFRITQIFILYLDFTVFSFHIKNCTSLGFKS
jgi:hypothetical protein